METYEQKKRRLIGKRFIIEYLEELNKLMNINITEKDLLSVVESDTFFKTYPLDSAPFFQETIAFHRKDLLKEILKENILVWNKPYIFDCEYSEICGSLKIPSLHCFNLNFNFYDEHSGFFTFNSTDGKEKIYFSCDKEFEEEFLEIKIYKE